MVDINTAGLNLVEVEIAPLVEAGIEAGFCSAEVLSGETGAMCVTLACLNLDRLREQKLERWPQFLASHRIVQLPADERAVVEELSTLRHFLDDSGGERQAREMPKSSVVEQPQVHRSLFSLARTCYQAATTKAAELVHKQQGKESLPQASMPVAQQQQSIGSRSKFEEREGQGGNQGQQQGQQQGKQKRQSHVEAVSSKEEISQEPVSIENVFIRFMALMARILGQAEAEAHDLYSRIKARTDQIDLLTSAIQKINTISGSIDAAKQPELMQLLERVRQLGVDIPPNKTKWTEEEKRLLKENIQMRKDSMEKITQLERTDMQRYLQEASQCHQARSNILKLLKEVLDTIIHNLRPG